MALNIIRSRRNRTLVAVAFILGVGLPFLLIFILAWAGVKIGANQYVTLGYAFLAAVVGFLVTYLILFGITKLRDTKNQDKADNEVMKEKLGLRKRVTSADVKAERARLKAEHKALARKEYGLRTNVEHTHWVKKYDSYIEPDRVTENKND